MAGRRGFTLVEILIAAGLLSALLLTFFGMFRSSTGQFQAGSWRHVTQKDAQVFLNHLRSLIEKANHPYVLESGNQRPIENQPIMLHTAFSGNAPVTLSGTGGILYFSVNTPAERAPPAGSGMASLLQTSNRPGIWSGVALSYQPMPTGGQRLVLIHSGESADLNTNLAAPYDCPPGGDFQRLPTSARSRFQLDDVEAVRIIRSPIATGPLEISVTLAKTVQGRKVSFVETVLAKPIHDAGVTVSSF
ncbi:MAG: hypothetical protein OZSIB_3429 [Candidatus Ozemobacter sibiricus]|jgi:prepilin-type N-terminal cleavage/methylation domain-containing protein|uniref:Prepilin-type N-terminal cleavage/methylation domain-containing protein n=1 Tax=Candidatus Ozemobacter sibiricus TaxID=2268124 RepID=A0A367ZQX5_9BACT|nr:MAG: hypothetical protein OZSIB_3429 [Candidatus Ozemobacter sibiricus]